jgi:methylphosphotriester-DNA--protein-cysteine methyltransferase
MNDFHLGGQYGRLEALFQLEPGLTFDEYHRAKKLTSVSKYLLSIILG